MNMINPKWKNLAAKAREQINKVVDDFEKSFEVIEDVTVDYDENEDEIEVPFWVVENDSDFNTAEWRAEISGSPEEGFEIKYYDYTETEGLGDYADSLEQAIEVAKSGILERVMTDIEDTRKHEILDLFLENLTLPDGFEIDDIYFTATGSQYFSVKSLINDEVKKFRVTIRDHEIKESTLQHGDLDIAIFVDTWDVESVAWAFQEIEEKIAKKVAKLLEEVND